ncbi:hypothetical protein BTA35_0205295 [Oceanospirillum linum]|uniref:Uncharacterized protein n=2 Tax=Oceanospirillum linum TaxID=966 RepID=A0A1T1HC79_OCELI|nr:hypothetical protein BTA35_0205295 [Oceanospirillum linum]
MHSGVKLAEKGLQVISRREFLIYFSGLMTTSNLSFGASPMAELRYLCWDGYDQPSLLRPFESLHPCVIQPEIISDSPAAFARLNQGGHRQYDIVSIDSPWLERLDQDDVLAKLPKSSFANSFQPYYPELSELLFDEGNEKVNWLPTQWGWIGPTINTRFVKEENYRSYAPCFSSENRGRIGIMDWGDWPMLPIALYLGINPYEPLDDHAIRQLQDAFRALFKNQPVFISNVALGQKALLDGSVHSLIGTGTYLTSAMRRAGLKQIKTMIPDIKNGMLQCIVWTEGAGAIKHQPYEALSLQWVDYIASEKAAFHLSYNGPTCNLSPYRTASERYSKTQWNTLQLSDLPDLWQNSLAHRTVPSIARMLEAWQRELMKSL